MVAPLDTAVVTCGSIHAGNGENIIPDSAELKLNVRSYDPKTRETVLKALKDIIRAECASAGAPQEPDIKLTTQFPLTDYDEYLADTLRETFVSFFLAKRKSKSWRNLLVARTFQIWRDQTRLPMLSGSGVEQMLRDGMKLWKTIHSS